MWPYKKKPIETVCHHKFKDFDWYISREYNCCNGNYKIKVCEPYVCIKCHYREDIELHIIYGSGYDAYKKDTEIVKKMYEKKIKPKAIIEDEINDMLMVDKDYLDAYYQLHPERRIKDD